MQRQPVRAFERGTIKYTFGVLTISDYLYLVVRSLSFL